MFTTEQINEIEAMCEKAEEGPWMIEGRYIESDNRAVVKAVIGATEADMQFVSQARTLLPALTAEYRKAMEERRWIPVSERLPEELQVVLVLGTSDNPHRKGYECGWLINGDWTCWHTKDVTHWMPLPAAPGLEG